MVRALRSVSLRCKRLPILFMVVASPIVYCSYAFAGNKEMVEEAVKELDELNKEAVQQISELPSSGKVELETTVTYQNGQPVFDFTPTRIPTEKLQEIHFNEGHKIDSEERKGHK